ncbi:MAG: thiamine pyrophosphate-dependent enzyme, partial [Halobacteria archaeon]|nr:thiamine pyrophosphate-dependent enzyme [Halobacteria archaeon]
MVKQLPSEYDFDNRIIEPDGSFDEDSVQELELGEEKLLSMYENMVRARSLDSRGMTLQRQGRIANWVPCSGQEGIHVGAATALGEDDWLSTYGRQHGAQLARGRPMKDIYLYWGGSEWGNVPPQGLNHLPVTIPIGTHIPHGVGVGWASKLKGNDEVSLIHFGDGATSEGDFHEGMNFA